MCCTRFLIAFGVMLAGLCAAWPFRQSQPRRVAASPTAAPLELTLRRPDAPLDLAIIRSEVSPAIGLDGWSGAGAGDSRSIAAELANLAPPPALPVSFQPATASPPNDWRPDSSLWMSKPPAKPRSYRLRDGDTLETIAQRLLGNRERAAEIFEANRNVLARPDLLPVGVTIVLPPRERPDDLEPVSAPR